MKTISATRRAKRRMTTAVFLLSLFLLGVFSLSVFSLSMDDLVQVCKQTRARPRAGDRKANLLFTDVGAELVHSVHPQAHMIDTRIYASRLRNESIISSKNFFATY